MPNSPYKLKQTANDPINGGTIKLDANATYHDWEQAIIAKHGEDVVGLNQLKAKNYRADYKQYRNYQEVLGSSNSPQSFEDFQTMKYNNRDEYQELMNAVREVNLERAAFANDYLKGEMHGLPFNNTPNSVVDRIVDGKLIERRYYGRTGRPRLDIDYTNHGNAKKHPIVPHAHTWTYKEREDGKIQVIRPSYRELTLAERIVNVDDTR